MHMKKILLISAFLLIGFFDVDASVEEQANFIKELNDIRRLTAVEYNISDMHELVYEKSFESLVKQLSGFNEFSNTQSDKRWFSVKDYKAGLEDVKKAIEQFRSTNSEDRNKQGKDAEEKFDHFWDPVNPLQTKIGCAKRDKHTFCILGDKPTLSGYQNSLAAPGSKCLQGYENDKGLCVKSRRIIIPRASSKSDPIRDFDPKKLVDDFNEERRKYAKNTERKNMHELTLNTNLNEIAKRENEGITCMNAKCRYTYGIEKEGIGYFQKKTSDFLNGKKNNPDYISENSGTPIIALEYLNPHQWEVGCARMEPNSDKQDIVCVFMPEGTLDSWKSPLNTACGPRFSFNNFLCTRDPLPTPPPPSTTVETDLDRQILKYKQNEKDGDVPSEEDEVEVKDNSSSLLNWLTLILAVAVLEWE